ncbi:hypothetical protein [Sphingobium bisphenolivorans]|uniref:hypothetical protein n=1 Tax=Sphingobium bisphenolivorans TaxID=1335760 RepID=UPI00039FB3A8|nr:hypothetical protein [Sphingobium bisphenolivorans]
MANSRLLNEVEPAWRDTYAYADECDRREAERNARPMPVITMRVLLAWSAGFGGFCWLAGWLAA